MKPEGRFPHPDKDPETRAIRTDHALRGIREDLKEIRRQIRGERQRSILQSMTGYVLFALLAFGAIWLVHHTLSERHDEQVYRYEEQQRILEDQLEELQTQIEMSRVQAREAQRFHALIQEERYEEAMERFSSLPRYVQDPTILDLFRRELERKRQELALTSHQAGKQLFDSEQYPEAREAFLRSTTFAPVTPYMDVRAFYIAEASHRVRDYRDAVPYYEEALESDSLPNRQRVIAAFRIAESLERSGQRAEALAHYESFGREHRAHRWSATARDRVTHLRRRMNDE